MHILLAHGDKTNHPWNSSHRRGLISSRDGRGVTVRVRRKIQLAGNQCENTANTYLCSLSPFDPTFRGMALV